MKTALIHDWLLAKGGSEKTFFEIHQLFPGSVYTLFYDEEASFAFPEVTASYLQKLPFSARYYRSLLPFFPHAIESFDLSSYDLLLSSSHAVAKGVQKREGQLHICYCYTPMRYAWDLKKSYLADLSPPLRRVASLLLERVRHWDFATTPRVDAFLAASSYVADRIYRNYGRRALCIYPPVEVEKFFLSQQREAYYITHARLVPYKRIDLLIEAFRHLPDRKLVIIGTGPQERALKEMAPPNVEFLGYVSEEQLSLLLAKARAYLFAAEEDFGIGVVEAQASGLPVLALRKGGVLETVKERTTGLFFDEPNPFSLIDTIKAFERREDTFNPLLIRAHAESFSKERFRRELSLAVQQIKEQSAEK